MITIASLPPDLLNLLVNAIIALLTWIARGHVEDRKNGKDGPEKKP